MHTKQDNIDRRLFLSRLLALLSLPTVVSLLQSCSHRETGKHITGGMIGEDYKTGHLLRTPEKIPLPASFSDVDILIAGGGIAGLSAKRWLQNAGKTDAMMLEIGQRVGGNSVWGSNGISAYPWAAHYLPVPDPNNKELIDFLYSSNVIKSFDEKGLPIYNEYYLCHDPEERLYINGYWQEGLVPYFGVADKEKQQIKRFFDFVESLRHAKGEDGKFHFAIPIDESSSSKTFKHLDNISFKTFLRQEGYTSPYLLWYLEYCCKDDYGALLQDTSAWAGLHYFSSRRGIASNAKSSDVLTWPEGNGFLMSRLEEQCKGNIRTGTMIYHVKIINEKVEVYCYDSQKQESYCIRANKVLLATPQYINSRIMDSSLDSTQISKKMSYAPWVVANISFDRWPEGRGAPLSWDNVIYGRQSVGYVYANHQDLGAQLKGVVTYYLPVTGADTSQARSNVHNKNYAYWKKYILEDLEYAHPGVTRHIAHIDVKVWGHGMIRPAPGFIWDDLRKRAAEPINNRIFFAHSDLSGISIFEEAFYQGIRAAKEILKSYELE